MALIKRNTAYSVNDIVNTKYGIKLKCTTAGTTSTDPLILDGTSPITDGTVVWEVQEEQGGSGQGLVDYAPNTSYSVGDIVIYNDKIYRCITAHTSTNTFDNVKWEEISACSGNSVTTTLLHFNIDYEDEYSYNWLPFGTGISIDIAEKKFGNGSLRIENSSYLYSRQSERFNFYDNDFTIECWFKLDNPSSSNQTIFASNSDFKIGVFCGSDAYLNWFLSSNGSSWNLVVGDVGSRNGHGTILVTSGWHHLAYVRSGTTVYGFLDGQIDIQINGITDPVVNRLEPMRLGYWGANTYSMVGNIDEFRVSNIARYTSSFTPSSYPFD